MSSGATSEGYQAKSRNPASRSALSYMAWLHWYHLTRNGGSVTNSASQAYQSSSSSRHSTVMPYFVQFGLLRVKVGLVVILLALLRHRRLLVDDVSCRAAPRHVGSRYLPMGQVRTICRCGSRRGDSSPPFGMAWRSCPISSNAASPRSPWRTR